MKTPSRARVNAMSGRNPNTVDDHRVVDSVSQSGTVEQGAHSALGSGISPPVRRNVQLRAADGGSPREAELSARLHSGDSSLRGALRDSRLRP
jgi:hypothetical protein